MSKKLICLLAALALVLPTTSAQDGKKKDEKKSAENDTAKKPAKKVTKKAPKVNYDEEGEKIIRGLQALQRGIPYWKTDIVKEMMARDQEFGKVFPKGRLFSSSHFVLSRSFRMMHRLDAVIIEHLDFFGALRTTSGRAMLIRAQRMEKAADIHEEVMDLMMALHQRYKKVKGDKKTDPREETTRQIKKLLSGKKALSPKDVKEVKKHLAKLEGRKRPTLRYPRRRANATLADAMLYNAYKQSRQVQRVVRAWRQLEKEVDAMSAEKRAKVAQFFTGKGAHPFSKKIDSLVANGMKTIFIFVERANNLDRRLTYHFRKNPRILHSAPADFLLLNRARHNLARQLQALGRAMGRTYYKLAGIDIPEGLKDRKRGASKKKSGKKDKKGSAKKSGEKDSTKKKK